MFDHDFHFGFEHVPMGLAAPLRLTSVGVDTDWHPEVIHDNSVRPLYSYIFLYTISGSAVVELEDGSKNILKEGMSCLLFMPTNTKYYTNPDSDAGTLWRYYYIMFIVDPMTKGYCNEIMEKAGQIYNLPPTSLSLRSAVDLITRRRNGLLGHPKLCFAAIYDFLCKLYYDTTTSNPNYSTLVQNCILIMKERYGKLNGLQELSDILNFTPEHISRTFSKEVGMSPMKYLTKLRMTSALEMLNHTAMPIHDIAKNCGFDTSSYFTKVFKNTMSISPSQYRKQNMESK